MPNPLLRTNPSAHQRQTFSFATPLPGATPDVSSKKRILIASTIDQFAKHDVLRFVQIAPVTCGTAPGGRRRTRCIRRVSGRCRFESSLPLHAHHPRRSTAHLVYMSIHAQVPNFIHHPRPDRFEELALAVFARQFEHDRALSPVLPGSRGVPGRGRAVAEIPPVSTAAFKYVEFCSGPIRNGFSSPAAPPAGPDQRGRHFVADLELYRASAISHLGGCCFPDRRRTCGCWRCIPPPSGCRNRR